MKKFDYMEKIILRIATRKELDLAYYLLGKSEATLISLLRYKTRYNSFLDYALNEDEEFKNDWKNVREACKDKGVLPPYVPNDVIMFFSRSDIEALLLDNNEWRCFITYLKDSYGKALKFLKENDVRDWMDDYFSEEDMSYIQKEFPSYWTFIFTAFNEIKEEL